MALLTPNKTPVQGVDVILEVSADNGVTYKKVVCMTKGGWQIQNPANITKTQCGTFVGLGGAEETVPVEGVVNIIDSADASEFISYNELKGFAISGTPLLVRQQVPASGGGNPVLSNTGKAYLTDINLDVPMDNVCTFTATLRIF